MMCASAVRAWVIRPIVKQHLQKGHCPAGQRGMNVTRMKRSVSATALLAAAIAFAGPAAANTTIGTGSTVLVSNLSATDAPDFQGGTLQVNQSGTYANNFTLDTSTASTSTIDSHGNVGTFTGVF
jgi:hypothetical protein